MPHSSKNRRIWPKLGVSRLQLQFEFANGYEMLHEAWNSKGEMPYRIPRSSIKFQGHTGQNITDFDPNWAFPDYRPVAAFKPLRFALCLVVFAKIQILELSMTFTMGWFYHSRGGYVILIYADLYCCVLLGNKLLLLLPWFE